MNYERLFAYNDWANGEEVARLRGIGAPPASLRVLNHIVGAEWLWLARLRNEAARTAVWPELTIEQCAAEVEALRDAWSDALRTLDRNATIQYRNSKGEAWSSLVDDVLTHVILHGSYHRGQIATVVRQGGETPAYTDYIHARRTGAV